MITREKKLNILLKIAKELNENNITWAIGASLLLYFKGITNEFNDIDIMIAESDVEKIKQILLSFGKLQPKNPNVQYKTKYFMEFKIDGINFDIMAGFVIVNNNAEYYFPLKKNDIKEYLDIQNVSLPLQSIEDWLIYYKLMDRTEKVKMINNYLGFRQENAELQLKKSKDELVRISNDDKQRALYEAREKANKDRTSALAESRREGIEEGIEIGLQEGEKKGKLETAKKCFLKA